MYNSSDVLTSRGGEELILVCDSRWVFVRIICSLKYLQIAQISKDISNHLKISKSFDVLTLGGEEQLMNNIFTKISQIF